MSYKQAIQDAIPTWYPHDYRETKDSVHFTIGGSSLQFAELLKLSEVLGTIKIDFYSSDAGGCPTCGPDMETTIDAYEVNFK